MNILLLEDGTEEIKLFEIACEAFDTKKTTINVDIARDIPEFKEKLIFSNKSYDSVVIDLKLSSETEEHEGNEAIKIALKYTKSILFIYSSTVQHTELELLDGYSESSLIEIIDRGEVEVTDLIEMIYDIYKTGITKYLNTKNSILDVINELFWNNTGELIDYLKKNPIENKEEIIQNYLGIALESKIIEDISKNDEKIPGVLLYISPKIKNTISTGTIIEYNSKQYFVITPACDLAQNKTNYLHLLELISEIDYLENIDKRNRILYEKKAKINIENGRPEHDRNPRKALFTGDTPSAEGTKVLNRLNENPKNVTPYFALPKGLFFKNNKIVDLHQIVTVDIENIMDSVEIICHAHARISKDIISQFSSQFNRQGSPDYMYCSEI